MIRFMQPNDLAAAPADRAFDVPAKIVEPDLYFEVANMSPYVFELQADDGQIRAIAGAFQYTAVLLSPLTSKLTFHVIATEAAPPIPAANYAVYAGLTQNAPVPSATVA